MISDYPAAELVTKSIAMHIAQLAKATVGLKVTKATQSDEHYCFRMTYLKEAFFIFIEESKGKSINVRLSRLSGTKRVSKEGLPSKRSLKTINEWLTERIEDKKMGVDYTREMMAEKKLNRKLAVEAIKTTSEKGQRVNISDNGVFRIGNKISGQALAEQPNDSKVVLNVNNVNVAPENLKKALELVKELENL